MVEHIPANLGCAKLADEFVAAVEERSGFTWEEIVFIDEKADNFIAVGLIH